MGGLLSTQPYKAESKLGLQPIHIVSPLSRAPCLPGFRWVFRSILLPAASKISCLHDPILGRFRKSNAMGPVELALRLYCQLLWNVRD